MKIVNLETFLKLPPNTVFAKYAPQVFGDLQIKGKSIEGHGDFFALDPIGGCVAFNNHEELDAAIAAAESGESVPVDFETEGRDGLYEKDQLFAVWEPADVAALIKRLNRCLPE